MIARDYTVVMGVTIVLAVLIVCINLVVDIATARSIPGCKKREPGPSLNRRGVATESSAFARLTRVVSL